MNKILFRIKKFWHYIWNDDSATSWVLSIIIAFLIIRFIFYPGIGLILGTSHPVVAVVSDSMDHSMTKECSYGDCDYQLCGNTYVEKQRTDFDLYWQECGEFYRDLDINKEEFSDFPFSNGFKKGDILVLWGPDTDPQVGDVIVFWSGEPYPIIHRLVEKDGVYHTKGDHNADFIYKEIDGRVILDERNVQPEQLVGKAVFRIPYLGYVKILFVDFFQWIGFGKLLQWTGILR